MLVRLKAARIAAALAVAAGLTLLCTATASAATDTRTSAPSSDSGLQLALASVCDLVDPLFNCAAAPADGQQCPPKSNDPKCNPTTSTPAEPPATTSSAPTTSSSAPPTTSSSSSSPASSAPPTSSSAAPAKTSKRAVDSGDSLNVSAGGFTPGERVDIVLHSTPRLLKTVTADSAGNIATAVRIPADTPAGQHTLTMTGRSSNHTASSALTVYVPIPSGLKQGDTFTVTVGGFAAGETIRAVLHSAPVELGRRVANGSGSATFTLTIPMDAPAGTHHIEFVGGSSGIVERTANFVLPEVQVPATDGPLAAGGGAADPAGGGSPVPAGAVGTVVPRVDGLAATGIDGSEAVAQAVVGVTLVAIGGGLLLVSRRRQPTAAPVPARHRGTRRH